MSARYIPAALAVAIGVVFGVGGYTFRYARGMSYFSPDPRACVNCHIMQREYDAWQASSHHGVAVCIDCHLPHDFVPKYLAKAENGFRHGERFTTGNFVEPIVVQPAGRTVLQENCLRCHGELVHALVAVSSRAEKASCLHCHAGAGHGEKAGLGGPLSRKEKEHTKPSATER